MRAVDFEQQAYRYELFAALKQLEQQDAVPAPLGTAYRRREEPVTITQVAHVIFAPSEVRNVELQVSGRLEVQQYAFGLMGPNGALPVHVAQLALERSLAKDGATAAFVDLFHHRFTTLFYRAWADVEPTVGSDRPVSDPFAGYLYTFAGLATPGVRARGSVPDQPKARAAARLGAAVRSAEGLEDLLSDYFGQPVRVQPYVGEWLNIPPGERCRLGELRDANQLGKGATLGQSSWQRAYRFELHIGPLDKEGFETFFPGSAALRDLADWVRLYTHDEWACSVRLHIQAAACSSAQLNRGTCLGWNSWLSQRTEPSGDVVLQCSRLSGVQPQSHSGRDS